MFAKNSLYFLNSILLILLFFLLLKKSKKNKKKKDKFFINYNIIKCFERKQNQNIFMDIKYI